MALLGHFYITEYRRIGQAAMDTLQAPQTPPVCSHFVEIHDDKSTQSKSFDSSTTFVRVWANTGPIWLAWGPSPVAQVGFDPLPGATEFAVVGGHRVAVIGGEHK